MKPSESIKKILDNLHPASWESEGEMVKWQIQAILDFLDRVAEREDERIAEFKKNIKE